MPRIDAIYKDGKFEPVSAVQLVEGTRASVEYAPQGAQAGPQGDAMSQINAIRGLFTAEEAQEFNDVVDEAFEDEDDVPW